MNPKISHYHAVRQSIIISARLALQAAVNYNHLKTGREKKDLVFKSTDSPPVTMQH